MSAQARIPSPRPEIDQYTIKALIGFIAFLLPVIEVLLHGAVPPSISQSYWLGPTNRTVFVGMLFALAALLLSYNGNDRRELVGGKIVCVAALVISFFPCNCECPTPDKTSAAIHLTSAVILFGTIGWFCHHFAWRAESTMQQFHADQHRYARRRMAIYRVCELLMGLSILFCGADAFLTRDGGVDPWRLFFWGEVAGLFGFGGSWFTASKIGSWLAHDSERNYLFRSV
ncbi:MAG: hypothetical protein JO370_05600 [Paucibacter sp.]|nr:hypothetical protein [Roseateles sp.]